LIIVIVIYFFRRADGVQIFFCFCFYDSCFNMNAEVLIIAENRFNVMIRECLK